MQGVSINIFIKTCHTKKSEDAKIFHYDFFGERKLKYSLLENNSIKDLNWNILQPNNPNFFFTTKDFGRIKDYEIGFKIDDLFAIKGSGIKFRKDNLLVKNHFSRTSVKNMIDNINNLSKHEILKYYNFKETDDWKIEDKKQFFKHDDKSVVPVNYRPFDYRFTYFPIDNIHEIIPRGDSRRGLMRNIVLGSIGFIGFRQSRNKDIGNFWVTKDIISKDIISSLDSATLFPLYVYPETNAQQTIGQTTQRSPNLNMEIVNQLAEKLSLTFVPEKEPEGNVCFVNNAEVRPDFKTTLAPIDILDYIYAVLHSPTYREKYKEFLKIDFPRVPYPNDVETFWKLVELGGEIRQIHLLESQKVNQFITSYPNDGNNEVTRKMTTASPGWEATNEEKTIGRVWINDQQYFDGVPLIAWDFYIGGYQPAQKWLKDRHNRTLNFEDILHYQKIIVALTETHRLMKEVDNVGVEFVTLL